jgi:hypothetical protein
MSTIFRTFLALILSVTAAHTTAAPQEMAPAGFVQARQQFIAGSTGDAKARDAAVEAFQSMAASNPGHPVLTAYEGAAITIQGRDAMMPWNKMSLTEKGANAIEKSLAQLTPAHDEILFGGVPESIEVRLIAASTLLVLPDFMNRGPMGKRALKAAMASPLLAHCPSPVRARFLLLAAKMASKEKRSADEKALLTQVASIAPQTDFARQAESRLKELAQ